MVSTLNLIVRWRRARGVPARALGWFPYVVDLFASP